MRPSSLVIMCSHYIIYCARRQSVWITGRPLVTATGDLRSYRHWPQIRSKVSSDASNVPSFHCLSNQCWYQWLQWLQLCCRWPTIDRSMTDAMTLWPIGRFCHHLCKALESSKEMPNNHSIHWSKRQTIGDWLKECLYLSLTVIFIKTFLFRNIVLISQSMSFRIKEINKLIKIYLLKDK